jgi:hypothetical protein
MKGKDSVVVSHTGECVQNRKYPTRGLRAKTAQASDRLGRVPLATLRIRERYRIGDRTGSSTAADFPEAHHGESVSPVCMCPVCARHIVDIDEANFPRMPEYWFIYVRRRAFPWRFRFARVDHANQEINGCFRVRSGTWPSRRSKITDRRPQGVFFLSC